MKGKDMDRRGFLSASARYAVGAAAGIAAPGLISRIAFAERTPDIAVAQGTPGSAVKAAVDVLGGMKRFVKEGAKVVIKPNASFPNPPESATTTHPELVRQLVSMCLDAGASSVMVLDNPLRSVEICLERSNLKDVCEGLPHAQVEGLTDKRFFETAAVPNGKALKSTMIMKRVKEADVLIAAPVAKAHSSTGVSLSLKGMMGLIYDRRAFHMDFDLDTAIVDLCTLLKPALTVVDATRLLSDNGPGGPGKVLTLDKVIASTDMVAADAMAVEMGTWYGQKFKASQVSHIALAHERGLGNMNVSQLLVKEVRA